MSVLIIRTTAGVLALRTATVDTEQPLASPPIGEPAGGTVAYGYGIEVTGAVYDVTDPTYGATGDGVTDDTLAIRAAISACKTAGGGHVYFPAGTYFCAPTVYGVDVFPVDFGNVAFVGDSKATTTLQFYALRPDGSGPVDPETTYVPKRGNGFRVGNGDTALQKVVFAGLTLDGQTRPNRFAGGWVGTRQKYEADGETLTQDWIDATAILAPGELDGLTEFEVRAVGWDIAHKAVGTWGRTDQILVTDCAGLGWRAEIFYSGGDTELGRYYLARTEIAYANGSATSIGHRTIYDDVDVWAVYNGVENFCRGISDWAGVGAQGAWLRNCRIRSNYDWPTAKGVYGVVYLGFRDSWLTVEDTEIDGSNDAAIFLSEYAHNVTIRDNTIKDTKLLHSINLGLYAGDPVEEYYSNLTNILISGNVCTTPTSPQDDWITNNNGRGAVNAENFQFLNNTVTGTYKDLYSGNVPPAGNWVVSGNDFTGVTHTYMNIGTTVRRPTWTNNTQGDPNGLPESYDKFSATPFTLDLTAPWQLLARMEGSAPDEVPVELNGAIPLTAFPDGWPLKIYRRSPSLADRKGGQVPPASWNSLARGYGIYRNASLDLVFNASTQKFDLGSYTPPDTTPATHTDTTPRVRFQGWDSVTMNPTGAVSYTEITGLPQNVSGTLNHNANLTITHQAGVLECPGGVDYAPGTSGTVSVIWDGTTHTVTIP